MKKSILVGFLFFSSAVLSAPLIKFQATAPASAADVNFNFSELESRISVSAMTGSNSWQSFSNNIYYMGGMIGIGTDIPKALLHLKTDINATGANSDPAIYFQQRGLTHDYRILTGSWYGNHGFAIQDMTMKNDPKFFINTVGDIGIGTVAPKSKLQVAGYMQLDITGGLVPPNLDCDNVAEYGRMKIDEINATLYICTQQGWVGK